MLIDKIMRLKEIMMVGQRFDELASNRCTHSHLFRAINSFTHKYKYNVLFTNTPF